jgi:dihydrolipoamide dehydrogenase
MPKYDIIVIGGGPGGYTAAIRAAQLGAKVALIEKDQVGGTCLNRGCIPTKAILESTKLFAKIKKADQFGISVSSPTLDWAKVIDRKNRIISRLVKGVAFLLKQHKIDVIKGSAKVLSPKEVEVIDSSGHRLLITDYRSLILATGSEPAEVPGYPVDCKTLLNCTQALELKELPKKVTIIGGGVMGVEFATFFSEAGAKVTIVEMLDRILPTEDPEVSQELTKIFKRKGIKIVTSHQSSVISNQSPPPPPITDYRLPITILTVGRKIDKIEVNERMETKTPGVYAVGDMTGIAMLAHVAMAQGKVAAENAMGGNATMDYSAVPWCIFTNPEITRVGLITNNLQLTTKTARFPFQALGKAQVMGETEGFIKIISEENTGRILGATIMGPNATDLIGELTLAIRNNLTVKQLIDTLHAHPTLHEGILEAAENIFGRAIHLI